MKDNPERHRFELEERGEIAFASYRMIGDGRYVIPHVEAPVALRGKGTADRLMEGIAMLARQRNIKIIPTCSYARVWFRRHPEAADVLG